MRKQRRFKIVAGLLAIVIAFSQWAYPTSVTAQDEMRGDSPSQQIQNPAVVNALKSSPVMFIENVGQMDSGARFQVRGANGTIWLADNSLWITKTEKPVSPKSKFSLPGTKPNAAQLSKDQTNVKGVNIKISFPGSNPHPTMETFNRLDTHVSYFIGNDSSKWKSDVPVWGGIRYKDLYPGIDLELTSEQGQMTEHIIAHDGADLKAVQMQVDGTSQLSIVGDELRLTTSLGDYSLPLLQLGGNKAISAKLLPSQIINGNLVISPFRISQNTSANAQPAASISSLLYSTYLGAGNEATSIALDASGEAYVTGYTMSSDFPTTAGAFDTSFNGGIYDAFVTKLNPSGSALVYSTFLGGSSSEMAFNIALDASGEAYVTGYTYSSDFPTTAGAFDTIYKGNYDAFVTKLNPSGSALVYSTFLGGSDYDLSNSVALDASGEAYVTGYTASSDFPTTAGAFDTSYDGGDAFVTKLNPSGSALVYSTYLGAGDEGFSIALNASGEAYVIGISGSPDFPTTAGAFDTSFNGGDYDAFVTKLNPSGSALVYSTFLGGSSIDDGLSIALDASGEAYVTGDTFSSDFPTTAGAFDTSYDGLDAFVTKLAMRVPSWTIMVYLDGDQSGKNGYPSLDSNYLNVFNQLENAANNPNVNIIVAWDRGGNNAAYYQVQTDGVNSWSKGNLDMGDPTTLSNFIQWVRTNYPAQHYALFISDHGTGLYGTAVDDTSGGDLLTVNELGNALSTATANGQNKLDVVFADSCLMAMIEDEYQIRNYANIYIASENPIAIPLSDSNDSKPYSNYIAAITSSTTPPELATEIVNNYASWLNNDFPAFGYTLSAVDLTKINPLINAIGSLAVALQAQMPTYSAKIQTARDSTQKFDEFDKGSIDNSDEYVDLDDLASELKNIPDTGIQNAAQSVIDAEGAYVIPGAYVAESGSRVYPYPSLDPSRVHGVSIFTPTGQLKRSFYDGLNLDFASGAVWGSGSSKILFSSDTLGWGPFLVNYVESVTPNATDDPNPPELASPVEAGFIISGNAGIAGATLTYIGGSTTSGSDGSYTIAVPTGWSGIITPSKTGYTFSPPDLDYSTTPVTTNLTDQDFTAIVNTYTLTYTAGPHGSITGTSPQTVNYGGNGTAVTAVPATGYHFVNWSDSSTANPRTDTNVTTNISVTANFAIGVERTKNGGFNTYVGASKIPQYWTASKFQTTDGKDTTTFAEGTASVKIIGKSGVTKTLTQTIIQSGLAGDKFTFSFQAKGSSIPVAGLCQAQVKLYSGTKLISTLSTVNCATSTYLFRLKTLKFTAPKAYNKIVVVFTYSKATGTVWFDAVSLMR